MGRKFNVTADCKPNLHYMVDISSRLAQMKGYVDRGEYFTINRARQYGKTTILRAMKEYLKNEEPTLSQLPVRQSLLPDNPLYALFG